MRGVKQGIVRLGKPGSCTVSVSGNDIVVRVRTLSRPRVVEPNFRLWDTTGWRTSWEAIVVAIVVDCQCGWKAS